MVTLEQYLEAKNIIKKFELIEAEKAVRNKILFLETIHEREEMAKEAIEFAEFLGYDINPIGCREDMFDVMKKEAINQIIELREKLYEITNSINNC